MLIMISLSSLFSLKHVQVSRVLRGYYLSALELVSHGDSALNSQFHGIGNLHLHLKEAKLRVEDALGACLLPSLQLVPANPAVGQEIWELMSLLPYEVFLCICCLSFYLIYCYLLSTRLADECYLSRHAIDYTVNGKKMMIAILCCWLPDKLPRFGDLYTHAQYGPSVLNAANLIPCYFCSLCFIFYTVRHQTYFEAAGKGKFKAAGSDGCKISSCQPYDCPSNNCSPGADLVGLGFCKV